MSTVTQNPNTFLSGVLVTDVIGSPHLTADSPFDGLAQQVLESRHPVLERNGEAVVLSLPVFCESEITSIVHFAGRVGAGISGVFEVWEPIGAYQDLRLRSGYFAHLERFQNVSSFVRFEQGAGLPGQAAVAGQAILHDNLKQHPGFLRAAGASAGELQTALALPVFCPEFLCSVVFISSLPSPLARLIEIWEPVEGGMRLEQLAACDTSYAGPMLSVGVEVSAGGVFAEVLSRQTAVSSSQREQLLGTRMAADELPAAAVVAIPTYLGAQLRSIALLWL